METQTKIAVNSSIKDTPVDGATWLQGVGWTYGKPAKDLKVGDIMVWNYGYTSEVAEIIKETPRTIIIDEQYSDYDGSIKHGQRKFKKDRIVAVGI